MSFINLSFKENLRLEVFAAGELSGALNLYVSNATINVTVEDNVRCPTVYDDYEYGISNGSIPTLAPPRNESCHINRLYQCALGDGTWEQTYYRDIFYIGAPPSYKSRNIGGDKGIFMKERMYAKNGKYEYSIMFSGRREVNTLYSKLNNVRNDTTIELGTMNQIRSYYDDNITTRIEEKIAVEMKPSRNEPGELNFKFSYKNERIFDGWFYLTSLIQRYATIDLPMIMEQTLERYKVGQANLVQVLSQYV